MENTIRRVIAMSILLVGLMVNAKNEDPKPFMVVESVNADRFVLSMKEVSTQTSLIIKDEYGFVIYMEQLEKSTNFRKVYSISNLPKGTYFIEIMYEADSKVYSLIKGNSDIVVKLDLPIITENHSMLAAAID